ncbi:MAG: hypothetical protein J7L42_07055, partial [Elusimicrobia bacterium]|nr:hypothetical protein [Elusimicrobiota bacterium]
MIYILVLILFLNPSVASASKQSADIYFTQAINKYMDGDLDGAIEKTESALEISPKNKKMKAFLLKLLVERGSRL